MAGDRARAEPARTADVAADDRVGRRPGELAARRRAGPAPPAGVPAVSTGQAAGERWLLVTVSLTAGQASLRVHVWRRLRSLGAVYLQSSVCLLPDRAEVLREVRRLLDRVHREGGAGRLLRVALTEPGEAGWLRGEFNAARDAEYAEVLERLPALSAELASERAKGKVTYAEVEESEADLDRFRSWLAKIEKRDYFSAPLSARARAAAGAAAAELAAFEEEALAAEAPAPSASRAEAAAGATGRPGPAGRLRAVE